MIAPRREVTAGPDAVGFGFSNPSQAVEMASQSVCVIIGPAIVRLIGQHSRDAVEPVSAFAHAVRRAIKGL